VSDLDACLDVDVLVAMTEGTLATERSEPVLAHVDGCARCAEVIANLGALDGPARRVGRYEIERVLGIGGMGIVYAAFDPQLQRRVALKLVRPENTTEAAQALIVAESRTLARISHPNVVAVYDAGEHDGEIYLATELVEGATLTAWQAESRTTAEIVGVWIQVARGLAAAHAMRVVHRDVKPANVFVGRDGRVRIGDFGIAHRETASAAPIPPASVLAGTPAYMSPEHRAGRVDARSDQFSACVAIAEALTGRRPDADDDVSVAPPALAAVLTRGLRANPDERLPTMDAFADALAGAIAPPPSRRGLVLAVGGAIVLVGGALAAWALWPASDACTVAPVPEGVWVARKAELGQRLPADAGGYIEHWLAGWSNAAGDVCRSREPAMRARRRACLEHQLWQLDARLAGLLDTPPKSALNLFITLDELPHPAWCSEAALRETPDPTPAQRAAVAITEAELAATTDVPALRGLLARARTVGYPPLVVAAARGLAGQLADTDRAGARRTLRDALEGVGGFAAIIGTAQLIGLLDADAVVEAETLVATERGRLARLGGDPALDAELDGQLGSLLKTAGRYAEAIAAFERALQATRIAYGPSSPQEGEILIAEAGALFVRDGTITSPTGRAAAKAADAIWKRYNIAIPSVVPAETPSEFLEQLERFQKLAVAESGPESAAAFQGECNLMNGYVIVEDPERAMVHARRAMELAAQLHLRTPQLAHILSQAAFIASELGRYGDALGYARDAVAVATELGNEDELAGALTSLGRASIEVDQPRAARETLERALAMRVRRNDPPLLRGVTRRWLALALWPSDRGRAREQATVARDELRAYLAATGADAADSPLLAAHQRRYVESIVAKLERWLREHRS